MADDIAAHTLTLTVRVPEWVPAHAARTESATFGRHRARLLADGHGYCWGCWIGGLHTTDDLELHHGIVEWATGGEADPAAALRAAQWLDFYGYARAMGDTPWTDADDLRGLVFLCQDCHTGAPGLQHRRNEHWLSGGLHYAPLPIWLADRIGAGAQERAVTTPPL